MVICRQLPENASIDTVISWRYIFTCGKNFIIFFFIHLSEISWCIIVQVIFSKTRVLIENAFGLCKGHWQLLQYIDVYSINESVQITRACFALHNFFLLHFDDAQNFPLVEKADAEPSTIVQEGDVGSEKRDQICAAL